MGNNPQPTKIALFYQTAINKRKLFVNSGQQWDGNKKRPLPVEGRSRGCCLFDLVIDYSPGAIAPVGQASAQVPQSRQVSGSIE